MKGPSPSLSPAVEGPSRLDSTLSDKLHGGAFTELRSVLVESPVRPNIFCCRPPPPCIARLGCRRHLTACLPQLQPAPRGPEWIAPSSTNTSITELTYANSIHRRDLSCCAHALCETSRFRVIKTAAAAWRPRGSPFSAALPALDPWRRTQQGTSQAKPRLHSRPYGICRDSAQTVRALGHDGGDGWWWWSVASCSGSRSGSPLICTSRGRGRADDRAS